MSVKIFKFFFSAQFGVLPANTTKVQLSEREPTFQTVFNHTWADHANLISVQYAGTGALKTDYTRTGKVIEIPPYFYSTWGSIIWISQIDCLIVF